MSGLIVPLAGMITLPVFARVFTRGQYGVIELGTTMTVVALTLTDAGLTAAALRSFYDYGADREDERRRVLRTGFLATTFCALAVVAVLVLLRGALARWLFHRPGEEALVVVIAGSVLAGNTWRYAGEVMRIRLMAVNYLATTLIAGVLSTTIAIVGVTALDWQVTGVFVAGVVGSTAAAAFSLATVRRSLAARFSSPELRRMLAYGLPLVPAAVAAWALALIDRIILSRLGSLSQVGQYAIANRLASLLLIGLTAFLFALTPFLLSVYSEDPGKEKAARGRTLTYLVFILSLAGLVLTLFARELIDVLAPKFDDAYKAVGPLMLGAIGYGIVSLLTTGFSIARKTGRLAFMAIGAAALNIGLNFALIPPWGIVGSAAATAVGYGVLAVAYFVVSQRIYRTPYEPAKVLTILALASGLGVLGVVPLGPEPVAITVKLLAVGAFLGGVWYTRAVSRAEVTELRKFVLGMIPVRLGRARA